MTLKAKGRIGMKRLFLLSSLFLINFQNTLAIHQNNHVSWVHPKLEIRQSMLNNTGLFTQAKIRKNERLAIFGGKIMSKDEVLQLSPELRRYVLQIDDNAWIGSGLSTAEPADLINHSCNPNAGIKGQILLVALRDIEANEEITFDYATVIAEWVGMQAIACNCGALDCRKIIKHDDWKNNILQKKYKGYFSTYLQNKIDALQTSSDLKTALEEHLDNELDDAIIAQELAAIAEENILAWKVPTIATQEINTIIAFAFGNRVLPNGNRLPGPMNEALADVVVQLFIQTNAMVYAQWEIAESIGNRIPSEKLNVINPTLDAQANVVYLSTAGVAAAILKHVAEPQKLGKVAVIAFNDHLHRCIQISGDVGMDAYAPEGYAMPNIYDENSGQPWTRDRFTYLVTDMRARISNYFEKLMAH